MLIFSYVILFCVVVAVSVWLERSGRGFVSFVGVMCGMACACIGIFSLAMIPYYYGAGIKAEMLNKEFGTSYTTEQVFFAESIIDEIREVQRNRVDLRVDMKGVAE